MMGPGPPMKKGDRGGSKNASTRALNTAGPGSSYASSGAISTDPGSSPTIVTEGSRISGEGWNLKRYQREDEALWGHETSGPGQRIMDAIAKAGSSAGRLLEGRLSKSSPSIKEETPGSYYVAKNPPVNDLHPPVVSTQPTHKGETRWMLQPPPPAKVMEGKERVNRSRSDSNSSIRKGPEGSSLSRQVTERLVEAKLQRGEMPYLESRSLSRTGSRSDPATLNTPPGQRHERTRSSSLNSSSSSDEGMRKKRRPPPISTARVGMSSDYIEHIPIPSVLANSAGFDMPERPSLRPLMSTIASSSNMVPQTSTATKGGSGHIPLRELSPQSSNGAINSRAPSPQQRLSPNANAMPASIPSVESKFPDVETYRFPQRLSQENSDPVGQLS